MWIVAFSQTNLPELKLKHNLKKNIGANISLVALAGSFMSFVKLHLISVWMPNERATQGQRVQISQKLLKNAVRQITTAAFVIQWSIWDFVAKYYAV